MLYTGTWVWMVWSNAVVMGQTARTPSQKSPSMYVSSCRQCAMFLFSLDASMNLLMRCSDAHNTFSIPHLNSVPVRLGKGQGAKEIWAQSSARTTKFQAQFSAQTAQNWAHFRARMTKLGTLLCMNDHNLITIQHVNETMSGHNFVGDWWKHFYISYLKTQTASVVWKHRQQLHLVKMYFHKIWVGCCVNRAGRKTIRAGRSALINMPSWNTGHIRLIQYPCFQNFVNFS